MQESISAETIFKLCREGESLATRTIERLAYYVGVGLANLTTILVPEIIAIGGGLTASSDMFLERSVKILRSNCGEVPAEKTVIRIASLQNDVGLVGAAAVVATRMSQADLDWGKRR